MERRKAIGHLFPAGGPVPPELVIGRDGEIAEIHGRLDERIHTLLTGRRRIGKTTVCDAVCAALGDQGARVIRIEVPESTDAGALLQSVIDRSRAVGPLKGGRRFLEAAEPLIESYLSEAGIPLDLSRLHRAPAPETTRKLLSLPIKVGEGGERPVILYFDELQRVVDYDGGLELLGEVVDIYSGRTDVVILVAGSDERAFEQMLVHEVGFGKLVHSFPLSEVIPPAVWRDGLPIRFAEADLEIDPPQVHELVEFSAGRPYATMLAARYAAYNARKLGSRAVGPFETSEGIAEAERHLAEDPDG